MTADSPWSAGQPVGDLTVRQSLARTRDWEVWLAERPRPDGPPQPVVVRRLVGPLRTDTAACEGIRTAAQRSTAVEHPAVIRTLEIVDAASELVIVEELVDGVRLSALPPDAVPLPVTVWIARELVRLSSELRASSDRAGEGPPTRDGSIEDGVFLTRDGAVRVRACATAWLGAPADKVARDVLESLSRMTRGAARPPALERSLAPDRAAESLRDLQALERELSRIFYVELEAVDQDDGESGVAAAVRRLRPRPLVSAPPELDAKTTEPGLEGALAARRRTVVPRPLTAGDQPTEVPPTPATNRAPANSPARRRRWLGPAARWFVFGFAVTLVLAWLVRQILR